MITWAAAAVFVLTVRGPETSTKAASRMFGSTITGGGVTVSNQYEPALNHVGSGALPDHLRAKS